MDTVQGGDEVTARRDLRKANKNTFFYIMNLEEALTVSPHRVCV